MESRRAERAERRYEAGLGGLGVAGRGREDDDCEGHDEDDDDEEGVKLAFKPGDGDTPVAV